MTKRIVVALLLLLNLSQFVLAQTVDNLVGGALISPLIQRLSVAQKTSGVISFKLENPSQTAVVVDAEIKPFSVGDWTYETIYSASGPNDCSAWFGDQTAHVRLEPNQKMDWTIPFKVPANIKGAHWAMLRVTPKPVGSSSQTQVVYEIPITILVGKNPKAEVRVTSPQVKLSSKNGKTSSFNIFTPIENFSDGFTPVGVVSTVKNKNTGVVVYSNHIDDRNLYPHSKRNLGVFVPGLPDGDYKLTMHPVLGNKSLPPMTADFTVKNGSAVALDGTATYSQSPLSLEPASLTLKIPPGGIRHQTVRIVNRSSASAKVKVDVDAVQQFVNGNLGFDHRELPGDVIAKCDSATVEVGANQSALVPLTIEVPKSASGDIWFAVRASRADVKDEIADTLMANILVDGTAKPGVTVEKPEIIRDGGRAIAIRYQVRNSGNMALRPLPSAALLKDGVQLVERLTVPQLGDGGLLPGAVLENTVMLPINQTDGTYTVEIAYQFTVKDSGKLVVPLEIATTTAAEKIVKPGKDGPPKKIKKLQK